MKRINGSLFEQIKFQKNVLNDLMLNKNTPDIISEWQSTVENYFKPAWTAIFIAEDNSPELRLYSAPSAPPNYLREISLLPIDIKSCPCGRAAHFRRPYILNQVETDLDDSEKDLKSLLLGYQIKSIYAYPIFYRNKVAAVVAFCAPESLNYSADEMELLNSHVSLLSTIVHQWNARAQVEAEQVLLLSNSKMAVIGEMAGGVAHEINNPLFILEGYLDILREQLTPELINYEESRKLCNDMSATVERIAKIVSGLNMFSKVSTDNFSAEPVEIKKILFDTVELCKTKLITKDTKVFMPTNHLQTQVFCNPSDISHVLTNLISNSSDAIKPEKEKWIKIETVLTNDFLEIKVIDSGVKPNDEVQSQLFESFFTTKPAGKGSGLGLSICKQLMERNEGRIQFNEANDHTEFNFRIPLAQKQPAKKSA